MPDGKYTDILLICYMTDINSLAPGKSGFNFQLVIYEPISATDVLSI